MPDVSYYLITLLADLTKAPNRASGDCWNYLAYALFKYSRDAGKYLYLHDGGEHENDPEFSNIFNGGDQFGWGNGFHLYIRTDDAGSTVRVSDFAVNFEKKSVGGATQSSNRSNSNEDSPFTHESSSISLVRNDPIDRRDGVGGRRWKKCHFKQNAWETDPDFPWTFKRGLDAIFEFSIQLDVIETLTGGSVETTRFKFDPRWQLSVGPEIEI